MSKNPISDRQLTANRANARKSTGPRTPEGQARVSLNALKHGLLADQIVLPKDQNESLEQLETIWARLREDLAPSTMMEELLIERLISSYWRLRRSYRFEVQSILEARGDAEAPMRKMCREMSGWSGPRMPAQLPDQADFDKLVRYEGLIDRNLHRITLQLARLRAARLSTTAPDVGDPQDAAVDPPPAPAPVPTPYAFDGTKPSKTDDCP